METGQKRKRDADFPRITYHVDASARSFDRLFKERSLSEMKDVARRKLNVSSDTPITFAQLREGKTIDLEDDDDFDAFYSVAHSTSSVDITVTVGIPGTEPIQPVSSAPMTPSKAKKKKRKLEVSASQVLPVGDTHPTKDSQRSPPRPDNVTDKGKRKISFGEPSDGNKKVPESGGPHKKKRKNRSGDNSIASDTSPPLDSSNLVGAVDSTPPRRPTSLSKNSRFELPVVRLEASTSTPVQGAVETQAPTQREHSKKKKKQVGQEAETSSVDKFLPSSAPPTESKQKKKTKAKSIADPKVTSVAKQPADVTLRISATTESPVHHLVEKNERRIKAHKPRPPLDGKSGTKHLPANSTENGMTTASTDHEKGRKSSKNAPRKDLTRLEDTGENSSIGRIKESKMKRRLSTSEELEAANADVKAAVSRILAAKRALLRTSVGDNARIRGVERLADGAIPTEASSPAPLTEYAKTQEPSTSTSSRNAKAQSASQPSAEITCMLCSLSPLHARERCPVVLGGLHSLENRLAEVQADATLMNSHPKVIDELKELVIAAQKTREKGEPVRSTGPNISPSHHYLSGGPLATTPLTSVSAGKTTFSPDSQNGKEHLESDDSSDSSDAAEDESPAEPSLLPIPSHTSLDTVDLNDLVRGPKLPLSAIHISSPDSSDEAEDQVLEEDEEDNGKAGRRHSRSARIGDSSEDEDSDEDHHSNVDPSLDDERHSSASTDPHADQPSDLIVQPVTFQAVDNLGESQEVDKSADAAFSVALSADTEIFKLADHPPPTESTPKPLKSTPLPTTSPEEETQVLPMRDVSPVQLPTPTQTVADNSDSVPDHANQATQEQPRSAEMSQRAKLRKAGQFANENNTTTPAPRRKSRSRGTEPVQASQDSIARRTRTALRTQSLSSFTPPSLPGKMGNKSRVIRPPILIETSGLASSNSVSLDTWETLMPSSPIPDMESTIMVDELRSSSPESRMEVDILKEPEVGTTICDLPGRTPSKDPLFILTESQPPFPYSQWNSIPPEGNLDEENDPISNDSDDEIEVEASIKSQSQSKSKGVLKYRRLTDIASQHALFSTPTTRPAFFPSPSQKLDMYGRSGHEEVESESDSDSDDSDKQEQSHIPQSRRAGVTRASQRKK
ncbi:hypothetical protein Hypma_007768 [Hypsizygus marmoreus]|uniref:Uncharacterized protein n=1 Tax=Hypsizygus marmoreus TaxID=39966 RepID=A0A369JSH3_HYPMA|nr:hypothetical protein Hypma_007768 [Hypsizygus marmoreus]